MLVEYYNDIRFEIFGLKIKLTLPAKRQQSYLM